MWCGGNELADDANAMGHGSDLRRWWRRGRGLWGKGSAKGQGSAHRAGLVKVRLKSLSIHRKRLQSISTCARGHRLMGISFTDSIRCQTGGKGHSPRPMHERPPHYSASEY